MSTEKTQSTAFVVILSILGILAITLLAGILLMQKQEPEGLNLGSVLTTTQPEVASDDFDPISWAREGAAYPPLQEPGDTGEDFVADFIDEDPVSTDEVAEPEVVQQPAALTPPPAEPVYREVRENAYWIQVFSSGSAARAEDIREELFAKGFPATVQIRNVDGETWYRVRIGAFEGEGEAEHYADSVRKLSGFESSYVVIAPVTRRVPVDG